MAARGRHATCLVVEDEPLTRWSLVRFLESRGLEAHAVDSAELALALLQEWPADVLISDVRLPGMDGLELVNRCQNLRRRPRIILVTGSDGPPLPAGLDRLGVLGVVDKPFNFDFLARLLASITRNKAPTGTNAGGAAPP